MPHLVNCVVVAVGRHTGSYLSLTVTKGLAKSTKGGEAVNLIVTCVDLAEAHVGFIPDNR
jgi:hypothetical protein